jgi:asparagine synthase (glutamine-hydrolysing)
MCGINGIHGLKDVSSAKEKIGMMNTCMKHRGPDDHGVFAEENIALGHRRLSIIDLSSAGHQPMASFDKRYQIIYNGELYNFKELKFELQRVVTGSGQQAYLFQTNTDTEVIIAAYARWGDDCLKRFNGMYAFAIWDSTEKKLFIARDRLGIKPLYYFFTNGVFGFSSEVRSLLAANIIPKKIDPDGLVDYLRYQTVHAPNTIIKGIKMLMPGNCITIKDSDVKIRKYWSLADNVSDVSKGKTYKEVCNDVNNLLTAAVERRLIADVPFGAFLSGGIDSSAIVGLMSKVSVEKVRTFSVTFDESEFSEAKYAKLIAKKFNTDHHEIKLLPSDFLNELPNALRSMDHPSGDGPNTYIVSKATKNAGITMALSGLGGDELFAGYDVFKRYRSIQKKQWLNLVPGVLKMAGAGVLVNMRKDVASEKIAELLRQKKIDLGSFYVLSRQVLLDKQVKELMSNNEPGKNSVLDIISSSGAMNLSSDISKISVAEISTYMQNVLLRDTDQMSMAHALEVRVPFLDYTLVEYVLGVKDEFKSTASPKKLLVDVMGDLLPDEIVNRPKMGFTLPWKNWMKDELKQFCEQRMISLSRRKMFNERGIIKLWNDFLSDDARVTWSRVWYLVVLENWLSENSIEA